MLLLTKEDVDQVLNGIDVMSAAVQVTEDAIRGVALETDARPPVVYPTAALRAQAIPMLGVLSSHGFLGGRISSVGPSVTSTARGRGYKVLFDLATLQCVALIEDIAIHRYLVGSHVGVATKWLANPGQVGLGLIGSGALARACLEAVATVRPVAWVKVFSPNREHCARFAAEASEALGLRVDAVGTAREAMADADVVNCATSNFFRGGDAVYEAAWAVPGSHVNTIARCEAPVHDLGDTLIFTPSRPDFDAIVPPWVPTQPDGERFADLASVIAGTHTGRRDLAERTLYLGPSIPAEHIAIGAWILGRARDARVGTEWPPTT
jgi:ornithine cyclodeaminase/alanine dehydrogenase-like protein (mu-crystallin family)